MVKARFQVDTRLAKLLSENYRSSERALKELVDNAWDADANRVSITLPEPLTNQPIVIEDNGSGMTVEELKREYLVIASDRRQRRGELTYQKNRKVKGRKGIGKFAGFMAASGMKLETWTRGKKSSFVLTAIDLDSVEDIENIPIEVISEKNFDLEHGTRITLSNLNQNLAFPSPDKFRELLLQEYGRVSDFYIEVNGKPLGVDDIQGNYTEREENIPTVGNIKTRFTILDSKTSLRQPGISIRVDGKIVGKPVFLGLDEADDFPPKLLKKLYGEVEVDGLIDDVTADWGALVENSEKYQKLIDYVQPILKEKFKEEYASQINLAQARLQKQINKRLADLPEFKRIYADKAIKSVLARYYGEPESTIEPIVKVLLDALERNDYRIVLDYIYNASHSDIARLAEVLSEFGLLELATIGEQASARLVFLDQLERLCDDNAVKEQQIHESLEKNLWVFGLEYSFFSSNKTLKRQIEDYLGKKYLGKLANKRPDLLLNSNYENKYLLIEFKRPSHPLTYVDYQQATRYRNDFLSYTSSEIKILVIGGKRGNDLPQRQNMEPNTEIIIFDEVISKARNQLNWLLQELGAESHA